MRSLPLVLLCTSFVIAQNFEVASLKPAAPYKGGPLHIAVSGGPGTSDPTRLTFSNATLSLIFRTAFNLQGDQKVDGPEWLNIDMFDVAAKLPPGATTEQMRAMLLNLLAERFHLTWHREHQNLPAYVLVQGKGRLRPPAPKNPAGKPTPHQSSAPGTRTITCTNCTLTDFVKLLGNPEGRFVYDETGLTGNYDFALTYEPVYNCRSCTVGGPDGAVIPPPPPPADQAPPILSVALEQQLGLKLEKKQRPTEVIVIDHIDRAPVQN